MCALQTLCANEKLSIDLYLKTDFFNKSSICFITIGFWYSPRHYGASIATQKKIKVGFPLCSDANKELPKDLAELVGKGKVPYITTKDMDGTYI